MPVTNSTRPPASETDVGPGSEPPATGPVEADGRPVIDAGPWFTHGREVWIELAGTRYRLRLTRRGRLILQK
jgi:hemin uptake protein HemP